METQKTGKVWAKFVVPSRGSKIQRNSEVPAPGQALLGEEAVVRESAGKTPEDHVLGSPVEAGHEVDGPLVHDLARVAVVLPENAPGLAGGRLGRV